MVDVEGLPVAAQRDDLVRATRAVALLDRLAPAVDTVRRTLRGRVARREARAGTLGALYIFYDFTRNLQLRGSAGTTSALDLIYTLRYD